MINKNEFINRINYEDKNLIAALYEMYSLSYKNDITIYTDDFYPPSIWSKLKLFESELGCRIITEGIFSDSERRMIVFLSSYEEEILYFPYKLLKIKNRSKFNDLKHKNYLGSIMSLGIKREKIGDLIIDEEFCFVPVFEGISEYILNNLENIGKTPCNIETIDLNINFKLPKYKFEEIILLSSSLRIDNIVAEICDVSRNMADDLLSKGLVFCNYELIDKKNIQIKIPSTISIRKYGKFKIEEIIGKTAKGRNKIRMKKFI